jgi:hypothetical protein
MLENTKFLGRAFIVMGILSLISIILSIFSIYNYPLIERLIYILSLFGLIINILNIISIYLLTPFFGVIINTKGIENFLYLTPFILLSLLMIFLGINLLNRRVFAWWGSLLILILLLVLDILPSTILTHAYIIPLILLILLCFDRKVFLGKK